MKTTFKGDFGKVILKNVRVQNKDTGEMRNARKFTVKKRLGTKKHYYVFDQKLLGDEWIEQPKQFSVFWGSVIVIGLVLLLGIITFAGSVGPTLLAGLWLGIKIIFWTWLIFIGAFCAFLGFIIAANKIKIESQKLDPNNGLECNLCAGSGENRTGIKMPVNNDICPRCGGYGNIPASCDNNNQVSDQDKEYIRCNGGEI